ncbi:unnamed protein product [Sphenostylis stenocarpa]|uniref:Uncharacterized protein n=1 Tax=Sphenostylis stenocarpa TaxID=92480 RepID=A0AA86TBS4_9FABA|nr:unnamed protein product [Sphenostylis stenocarpa]
MRGVINAKQVLSCPCHWEGPLPLTTLRLSFTRQRNRMLHSWHRLASELFKLQSNGDIPPTCSGQLFKAILHLFM